MPCRRIHLDKRAADPSSRPASMITAQRGHRTGREIAVADGGAICVDRLGARDTASGSSPPGRTAWCDWSPTGHGLPARPAISTCHFSGITLAMRPRGDCRGARLREGRPSDRAGLHVDEPESRLVGRRPAALLRLEPGADVRYLCSDIGDGRGSGWRRATADDGAGRVFDCFVRGWQAAGLYTMAARGNVWTLPIPSTGYPSASPRAPTDERQPGRRSHARLGGRKWLVYDSNLAWPVRHFPHGP